MKESEKDRKLGVVEIIVVIILIAIGVFILFGMGGDWTQGTSRFLRRAYGIVGMVVLYLVMEYPKKRKNDHSTAEADQSLEQEPEQEAAFIRRKYSYFINYLHMAVVLMLLLTIYLRKMGLDGSNGGIDFANIAGGSFLILLFVAAGLHLFRFRPQWQGSSISSIIYKIFVVLVIVGGLLIKLKAGMQ